MPGSPLAARRSREFSLPETEAIPGTPTTLLCSVRPAPADSLWPFEIHVTASWAAATCFKHIADAATSDDGGKTWTLTNEPPLQGAIFCLAYVRGTEHGDAKAGEALTLLRIPS